MAPPARTTLNSKKSLKRSSSVSSIDSDISDTSDSDAAWKAPKKRLRTEKLRSAFTACEAISVEVGEGDSLKTYTVHKDLLCESSKFFTAAVSGGWLETSSKKVKLPDHQPKHFEVYLEWLYGSRYNARVYLTRSAYAADPTITNQNKKVQWSSQLQFMVETWLLGDYLGAAAFQKAAMKGILSNHIGDGIISQETVLTIAKHCSEKSKLYRWLVDASCAVMSIEQVEQSGNSWPRGFVREMLKTYMQANKKSTISEIKIPITIDLDKYIEIDT